MSSMCYIFFKLPHHLDPDFSGSETDFWGEEFAFVTSV